MSLVKQRANYERLFTCLANIVNAGKKRMATVQKMISGLMQEVKGRMM